MATTFTSAASLPASGTAAHRVEPTPCPVAPVVRVGTRPPRHQFVDAVVTIAAMAWLAAALVGMAGELYGVPAAAATQSAAASAGPVALPQAATTSALPAHAGMRLI